MQDEDVWFRDPLTDFVEEKFLLQTERELWGVFTREKHRLCCLLTVFMSVDSAFPTRTKTSASKQNLSIQLSSSRVTSVPGLLIRSKKQSTGLGHTGHMSGIQPDHPVKDNLLHKYIILKNQDPIWHFLAGTWQMVVSALQGALDYLWCQSNLFISLFTHCHHIGRKLHHRTLALSLLGHAQ